MPTDTFFSSTEGEARTIRSRRFAVNDRAGIYGSDVERCYFDAIYSSQNTKLELGKQILKAIIRDRC